MTQSHEKIDRGTLETPSRQKDSTESTDPIKESKPAQVTAEQGEKIIAELRSIKQNIFVLMLLFGFFAARAFLFHY